MGAPRQAAFFGLQSKSPSATMTALQSLKLELKSIGSRVDRLRDASTEWIKPSELEEPMAYLEADISTLRASSCLRFEGIEDHLGKLESTEIAQTERISSVKEVLTSEAALIKHRRARAARRSDSLGGQYVQYPAASLKEEADSSQPLVLRQSSNKAREKDLSAEQTSEGALESEAAQVANDPSSQFVFQRVHPDRLGMIEFVGNTPNYLRDRENEAEIMYAKRFYEQSRVAQEPPLQNQSTTQCMQNLPASQAAQTHSHAGQQQQSQPASSVGPSPNGRDDWLPPQPHQAWQQLQPRENKRRKKTGANTLDMVGPSKMRSLEQHLNPI